MNGIDVHAFWDGTVPDVTAADVARYEPDLLPYLRKIYGAQYDAMRDVDIHERTLSVVIPIPGFKHSHSHAVTLTWLEGQSIKDASAVIRGYSLAALLFGGNNAALNIFSSTALSHTCYGTPMPATLNQLLDGNFEASVDAFFCRITHWHATVAFDVDHEELIQNNAAAYRFMLSLLCCARYKSLIEAVLGVKLQSQTRNDVIDAALAKQISLPTLLVRCWARIASETRRTRAAGELDAERLAQLDALNARQNAHHNKCRNLQLPRLSGTELTADEAKLADTYVQRCESKRLREQQRRAAWQARNAGEELSAHEEQLADLHVAGRATDLRRVHDRKAAALRYESGVSTSSADAAASESYQAYLDRYSEGNAQRSALINKRKRGEELTEQEEARVDRAVASRAKSTATTKKARSDARNAQEVEGDTTGYVERWCCPKPGCPYNSIRQDKGNALAVKCMGKDAKAVKRSVPYVYWRCNAQACSERSDTKKAFDIHNRTKHNKTAPPSTVVDEHAELVAAGIIKA